MHCSNQVDLIRTRAGESGFDKGVSLRGGRGCIALFEIKAAVLLIGSVYSFHTQDELQAAWPFFMPPGFHLDPRGRWRPSILSWNAKRTERISSVIVTARLAAIPLQGCCLSI